MHMPKNRWLAFLSHLGISLLIFLALLLLIVFFWYPGALFTAAGGWAGTRIIIGVDLVIGPLLTLVVYDIAKSRPVLFRDLTIIALVQLSCLAAGTYIVYHERPVAVIYVYDRFYVSKLADLGETEEGRELELSPMTPKVFYSDIGRLADESGASPEAIIRLYDLAGKSLAARTDLYAPFPKQRAEAAALFEDGDRLEYPGHGGDCFTIKLVSTYETGIACYDVEAGLFRQFVRGELNMRSANADR